MVFATKDDSVLHREIGQGYISINDVIGCCESPWVELPWINRGERQGSKRAGQVSATTQFSRQA